MEWIDYLIIGIVAALVVGVSVYLVKQKKKGKGGCGCGCSGCPNAGACSSCSTEPKKPNENK